MSLRGKTKDSTATTSTTTLSGQKTALPLLYGGLGKRFFERLSVEPDKILQVDTINNVTESRGTAKTRSCILAQEMTTRGIKENDLILISSKTHAHQTVVVLASLFVGAIVCPINPESPYKESLLMIKKLKPKMCFCDSRTISQIERILMTLNMTSEVVTFGNESSTTQFVKLFPFKGETDFTPVDIEKPQNEVAFIIPTQGTTGEPQLVCLSHHNILYQTINFVDIFENPSKMISFFPLSWIIQTIALCSALEFGITLVMAASFNERMSCKIIHDFRIDCAILGTELALRLTANVGVKDYNLSCLKSVMVGLCNTSRMDMERMRKVLPQVKFLQVYSLTETGPIAAVTGASYSATHSKPTTVGRLLKNSRIKIVNPNKTQQTVGNKFGELLYHGDGFMLGYFKDNIGTMEAVNKGYFKTGDLARIDEDGWIFLEGRIEDIILYKNNLILPRSIEENIYSHPQIKDAVLIGDEEELLICVEKEAESPLTAENIRSFILKKMPDFKLPITGIIFCDSFPRGSAGSIRKYLLRENYLKVQLEYSRSLASIEARKKSSAI